MTARSMKSPVYEHILLDDYSATPKYQQLANSIIEAVKNKRIVKDQMLPSLNEISTELEISRDTAERGYRLLKERGVLGSVPGKGYFIKNENLEPQEKVFLLFNKLSTHKKLLYDAIASSLGTFASIDLYIYDNDFSVFKKLLLSKKEGYTHYVIIPHFIEGGENAHEIINTIDKDKLILLDKLTDKVNGPFGAVYENFERDIFNALKEALPRLSKYNTLKIIFPQDSYFPQEIVNGFSNFCDTYAFAKKVVHQIANETIQAGEVYINLMEDDLVTLIEKILLTDFVVGKDVGVISYNETPLKKIILQGITTISTDFKLMGEQTALMIRNGNRGHVEVPFYLTLRASL